MILLIHPLFSCFHNLTNYNYLDQISNKIFSKQIMKICIFKVLLILINRAKFIFILIYPLFSCFHKLTNYNYLDQISNKENN